MTRAERNAMDSTIGSNVVYYAMGPNCWGKGRTLDEAIKNGKANFPRSYFGIKRAQAKHFSVWEITRTDGAVLAFSDIAVSDIDGAFTILLPKGTCSLKKLQTSTLAS